MNEKPFFDVFRTLQVDEQSYALLAQTVVTKVATTPRQDVLRVYITSKKLIAKNQLFQLAKQIQRQIFGYRKVQVHIFEKFLLSGQYTPEKLWSVYEESVLTELEVYSPYKRSIMKNAKLEFPDEHTVTVGISNRIYDKEAVDDLLRILDKVFNERCGFRVRVDVKYLEPKGHVSMEKSQAELKQRIDFLTENLRREKAAGEEAEAKSRETALVSERGNGSEKKASLEGPAGQHRKDKSFDKGRYPKGNRSFGDRGCRRSDNPDVLYGRDFEDEPIPLDQIIEEMGEVTIRGSILNIEEREIRGERTIITLTVTEKSPN